MTTTDKLTLDELHEVVDETGRGQTGDEEYEVCVVDTNGFKVYRVQELRVNDEKGSKMLAILIDTSK